jgi:tRNA G18 (ribose-2'-O)-methylase SpoU
VIYPSPDRTNYAHLPRYPLVICAALLTNPENLGNLCRTVEAFRLEQLVLPEQAIAHHPAFRRLAVSSQQWQPLDCCETDHLIPWLHQVKTRGYTRIALDANPAAIPLTQFPYPLRSVLVLGRELTGIPAEVISHCDQTVTIPQFGLVPSLNVRTAAAIAIYEYIRQHAPALHHPADGFRHPG